jgi:hypothetical protein
MAGMSARLRNPRHLVRLFLEGLLVLAFLIQPVFVAAGELHALSHGGETSHVLHDEISGTEETPADPAEAPHLLLHFAHCCGHAPTALLAAPLQVIAHTDSLNVQSSETTLRLQNPTGNLLRPPIQA